MEYERKGIIITWQIDNIKNIYEFTKLLYSPIISLDMLDRTRWQLRVKGLMGKFIWLAIKREEDDNGPEALVMHYKFSAKTLEKDLTCEEPIITGTFQKNDEKCSAIKMCIEDNPEICAHSSSETIVIRCKIWKHRGSILKNCQFLARTVLKADSFVFVGEVQNFKDFPVDERKTLKIVSSFAIGKTIKINFVLSSPYLGISSGSPVTYPQIEIIPIEAETDLFLNFKLFILDSSGNKTDVGKIERNLTLFSTVDLPIPNVSKENLLEKADVFLKNDTLSLHCEVTLFSGVDYEKVERSECETDFVTETDFSKEVEALTSLEAEPCDIKLQTATETFSAHAFVLSAQSEIFEAMFRTDMMENIEKCVQIDDVDAETMKRMLMFLYSNTLESMEWKDAMKLYFAADKYLIVPLMEKCISILKQAIDLSNCIVLLLFVNMHSDEVGLKRAVDEFIIDNRNCVVHCDQWRDLENNFTYVAIDYFRHLCTINGLI